MNHSTITLEQLSIGYLQKGNTKVVASQLNAEIRQGELTCLLGSNGVGKSTLLRTLAAFQPKLEGEVWIDNDGKHLSLSSYTDKQLSRLIGVVLTEKPDVKNMTVRELVGLGRSPYTGFWGILSDTRPWLSKRPSSFLTNRRPFLISRRRWRSCNCCADWPEACRRLSSCQPTTWNWPCK